MALPLRLFKGKHLPAGPRVVKKRLTAAWPAAKLVAVMQPPPNESRAARFFVAVGALNGACAVAMGAFGAHALRGALPDALFRAFETSTHYQGAHALALIAVGLLLHHRASRLLGAAGWLLLAGILLFCGSLYAITLGGVAGLGPVTPAGGLALIGGWLLFALGAWRRPVE